MNRLKELRKEKKLTQKELADIIGTTKLTISNWENGKHSMNSDKAQVLADFFGVPVGYLLGYSDEDYRNALAHGVEAKPEHVSVLVTQTETDLIATYRLLSLENQKVIQDMAWNFVENQVYTEPQKMLTIIERYQLLYGENKGIDKLREQISLLLSIAETIKEDK